MKELKELEEMLGIDLVVAGGYVRDNFLGRGDRIKDVDVFFEGTEDNIDHVIAALFKNMGAFCVEDYEGIGECVWQATILAGCEGNPFTHDVNFIALNVEDAPFDALTVINRCDFGPCQAALTSDGVMHTTEMFHNDCESKTFTLRPDILETSKVKRSCERFERFKASGYEDFTLVLSEEQQDIQDWNNGEGLLYV